MTIKKFFLAMMVALAGVLLVSCGNVGGNDDADPIEYDITFYDENLDALDYKVGDLDVDPAKVYCIDIKFDRPMNTEYSGFWYNWASEGDIPYGFYGFKSTTTYRVWPNLRYDTYYNVTLNPKDSKTKQEYSDSYFRDTKGNYLEEVIIDFNTKRSTLTHPHTFEFNLEGYNPIKFKESEYDAEGNATKNSGIYNASLHIMDFLEHENLKEGDTLKINYKVWVDKAANNIQAQIADTAYLANYWNKLANNKEGDKDPVFIDTLAATTDSENPVCKSGTLTYTVTGDTKSGCLTLQLYYTIDDAVDKDKPVVTLNFIECD